MSVVPLSSAPRSRSEATSTSTFGRDWRRIAYLGCVLCQSAFFLCASQDSQWSSPKFTTTAHCEKTHTPRSDPSRTPRARFSTARSVVIAPRVTSSAELITMPCARVHLISTVAPSCGWRLSRSRLARAWRDAVGEPQHASGRTARERQTTRIASNRRAGQRDSRHQTSDHSTSQRGGSGRFRTEAMILVDVTDDNRQRTTDDNIVSADSVRVEVPRGNTKSSTG